MNKITKNILKCISIICCMCMCICIYARTNTNSYAASTQTIRGTCTVNTTTSVLNKRLTLNATATPPMTATGGTYAFTFQKSTNGGSSWSNVKTISSQTANTATYTENLVNATTNWKYRVTASYSFKSDESYALIDDAYLAFLQRHAEPEGNQHWWSLVSSHSSTANDRYCAPFGLSCANEAAAVAMYITFSAENQRQGTLSNPSAFVNELYRFYLGRDADPDGLNHWVSIINANTQSHTSGAGGSNEVTFTKGQVMVVNSMASNASCASYIASKYAYNTSTGKFNYSSATTYTTTTVYTYTGTSNTYTIPNNCDALGHNYVATDVAPTCLEQGYTNHQCTRCSSNYQDNYIDPTGHEWILSSVEQPATVYDSGIQCWECAHDSTHTTKTRIPQKHFTVYFGDQRIGIVSLGSTLIYDIPSCVEDGGNAPEPPNDLDVFGTILD